jgi:hypothetical protein
MFSDPNTYYGFIAGACVGVMFHLLFAWLADWKQQRNRAQGQPRILQPRRSQLWPPSR